MKRPLDSTRRVGCGDDRDHGRKASKGQVLPDFRGAFNVLLQSRVAPRFIWMKIIDLITGALWTKLSAGLPFLKISSKSKCRSKCLSIFHFCLYS